MIVRPNDFDIIPPDVLRIILSFLNPESLVKASRVNKKFHNLSKIIWMLKLKIHSPRRYHQLRLEIDRQLIERLKEQEEIKPEKIKTKQEIQQEIENTINWKAEFRQFYIEDYKNPTNKNDAHPPRVKLFFSFTKEGDVENLDGTLTLADLDQKDINKISLRKWAKINGHQNVLNYFFRMALKEYSVESVIDVQKMDSFKRTILHWAILCHQSEETIDGLIEQGADINATCHGGETPLHLAVREKNLEAINALLTNQANINAADEDGATPLYIAAQNGSTEIVENLVTNNADINAARYDQVTPLYIAAQNGHVNVVRVLLNNKANMDIRFKNGATPLYIAAEKGRTETVTLFLENQADINAGLHTGETPLFIAAQENRLEVVKILLEKNANITAARRDGVTPLFVASNKGHLDVVNVLLEKDATIVNVARRDGATPLFIAAQEGHLEVALALLEKNADTKAICKNKTPLDIAKEKDHSDMVQAIQLFDYIADATLEENGLKKSFHLFKPPFTATQRKEAANALKKVVFYGANESCLAIHLEVLKKEKTLRSIYKDFLAKNPSAKTIIEKRPYAPQHTN